jgi:chitinase
MKNDPGESITCWIENYCMNTFFPYKRTSIIYCLALVVVLISTVLVSGAFPRSSRPSVMNISGSPVIQGYYPYWEYKKHPPSKLGIQYLTHLSHAFAWPDTQGNLIIPDNFTRPELRKRLHLQNKRFLLCIGGSEAAPGFPVMAANPTLRKKFIAKLRLFCHTNGYDGIEIDWEFPRSTIDSRNLTILLRELRKSFGPHATINLVVNGSKYVGKWIDVRGALPYVTYFVVMSYDYHGPWSKHSGHNAPLIDYPGADGSVTASLEFWLNKGVPRAKMIMGLPFYGRFFTCKKIGDPFSRGGHAHYRELVRYPTNEYTRTWDTSARVPLISSHKKVWICSYDNPASLTLKTRLALSNHLAGVMIWHIAGDMVNDRHLLLPSIYYTMKSIPEKTTTNLVTR